MSTSCPSPRSGRSGLVVSPLALGTITFGPGAWATDEATSRAIFDAYRAAGGNFVDTADIYTGGQSEMLVGQFIAESRLRDDIVLATKFAFNGSASPLAATQTGKGNVNAGGGGKNIHRALDASLKRLGTDFIDLYWMHIWDGVTPVDEVVHALDSLVRAGKIRYYGLSDMTAWLAMKAATIASERGVPGPIALKLEYSLGAWDVESGHFSAAREGGMDVMPWSPLAGGFLSGKYQRGKHCRHRPAKRRQPVRQYQVRGSQLGHSRRAEGRAAELDRPAAQVALAWTLARAAVA